MNSAAEPKVEETKAEVPEKVSEENAAPDANVEKEISEVKEGWYIYSKNTLIYSKLYLV